jgi:hypothetical protein
VKRTSAVERAYRDGQLAMRTRVAEEWERRARNRESDAQGYEQDEHPAPASARECRAEAFRERKRAEAVRAMTIRQQPRRRTGARRNAK